MFCFKVSLLLPIDRSFGGLFLPPCLDKPIEYAPASGDCVVNCMKMHTVWDYPPKNGSMYGTLW